MKRMKPRVNHKRADHCNYFFKRFALELESSQCAVVVSPSITLSSRLPPQQCIYCNAEVKKRNVDELVPITKYGRMNKFNQVPCCGSCNSSKGNKVGQDFELWLVTRGCGQGVGDHYVTCERANTIIAYMDTHIDKLCYGPANKECFKQFQIGLDKLINVHYDAVSDLIDHSVNKIG